ncbi:MAG: ribosome maturation factor RimM [Austwickia sp.]|nr:ribosome maturation factor RimM [Austwickia sp.]MBK8436977.1 ribosome maturation factor RimM [Austwickia sp.]MBK9100604.1 ribosome maturation factor RimM [Austwickia sp.]
MGAAPAERPVVARIGKAHGIRGEVTVESHTDRPRERFAPGARFDLDPGGVDGRISVTVTTARDHRGTWLLGFEDVTDRTAAEALRGQRLLLPHGAQHRDSTEAADADARGREPAEGDDESDEQSWYEEELIGLHVQDVAGHELGAVAALHTRPAQDLVEVRLTDGRTVLIPFVTALVPVVDVPGGRVVIDPPDGLLDLAQ